ncbi:MAG: class I adenylate-forming enzyme family protein, partial [Nostocoides sp.]
MTAAYIVGEFLRANAERLPDHPAVVFPDSRQTYEELAGASAAWSRRLIGLGVQPGEHVGLLMTNTPEFIELVFAICSIGAVAVPFNPRYRALELQHVIADADVRAVVVGRRPGEDLDLLARLVEAFPDLPGQQARRLRLGGAPVLRQVVSLDGPTPGVLGVDELDAASEGPAEDLLVQWSTRVRPEDVALIMYTSGTTAQPKGAVLSHEALTRTAEALALARYALTPADRMWDPLPLFHMSGLLPLLASVRAGSTFLCMARVDAGEGLAMMRREQATVAFVAFAQLALDLIAQPDYQPSELPQLRIVHTGGVPEVLAKVQLAFPQAIQVNPYGCTEAGGMCATSELSDSAQQRATFSGRPYPGLEILVVDAENKAVPTGVAGEILIRGYSLFNGYYNNPDATAAVVDAQGWLHTGDLGELDAQGRIRYISRIKDMLKVGGENVACVEIENFLCGHPAVGIAAVIGVPDERLAEVPVAFVELRPGANVTEEELIAYCRGRIASFKVPRQVR